MKQVMNAAGRISAVGVGLAVSAGRAAAANGGAGGLPWESGLTTLQTSLTGPVALAVSVIALAATGAALVFGGEMTDFSRRVIQLVMGIAILVGGTAFMTAIFPNASGALVL